MPFDVQGALTAGVTEDQILAHLTGSRPFDVDGATKAGASKRQIIDHLANKPPKAAASGAPVKEAAKPEGSIVGDLLSGAASGLATTVVQGGDLIRRGFGMERIINKPDVQELMRAPDSTAGTIGRVGESLAEFAVPLSKLTKATAALPTVARMGIEGAAGTGVAGIQTGGDLGSMVAGGLLGAAVPAAVPAAKGVMSLAQWMSSKPLAREIVGSVPVVGPLAKRGMQYVARNAAAKARAAKTTAQSAPAAPPVAQTAAPVPVVPPAAAPVPVPPQGSLGAAAAKPLPAPVPAPRPRDANGRFLSPQAEGPKPANVSSIEDAGRPIPRETEAAATARWQQSNADLFSPVDNPLASRTFAPTTELSDPWLKPKGPSLLDATKSGKVESISREMADSLGESANAPLAPKSSAATKITQARLDKAEPLADYLTKSGVNPVDLEQLPLSDPFWKIAAKKAGVNPPGSEETKSLILATMKRAKKGTK